MLKVGQVAPEFASHDAFQNSYELAQNRGRWVVLFFYPKDGTPGCTAEACDFRDNYAGFSEHNALVWGISRDSASSHTDFAHTHQLTFPLLLDNDGSIAAKYHATANGLVGKLFGKAKRVTYLIDPQGKVAWVWDKVNPMGHAKQVLQKVIALNNQSNQLSK